MIGRSARFAALALLAPCIPCIPCIHGCDTSQSEAPLLDTRSADPVAAARSTATLNATAGLIRLGQVFRAREESVENIGPDAVAAIQFAVVVGGLRQFYERTLRCPHEDALVVDGSTLTATFSEACDGTFVQARGTLSASVAVEQAPCDDDDGQCPNAIVWTLSMTDLQLSSPRRIFAPRFDGAATLRSPLRDAEPMTLQTGPDFSIAYVMGRIGLRSEASWRYEPDTECIDSDFSGRVEVLEDFDDEQIGDVIVEVDGFRRCADRCPEAGDVNIIYGFGEVLRWAYDGDETATVIGPRGREFEAMLPCAT